MGKRIIISVISDLVTDQRVHRAALSLHHAGYDVLVVGRQLKASMPMQKQPYQTLRFKLWWEKGALFYASFNLKLFFFLLNNKAAILHSNDLDTLLPNFLISRFRHIKLVYDSHEYFTEVPELIARPRVQNVWKAIERFIFPKLKNVYTVNQSIASIYKEKYDVDVKVIRNVPLLQKPFSQSKEELRNELGLPTTKKIFILQGSGINIQRGAEEAVEAMKSVENALLLIVGSGDVIPQLKVMVEQLQLKDKVSFKNKMPAAELRKYTFAADVGLSIDKDTNLNYRYSLPNKLFDYIHAGIPVIASNLIEVSTIVKKYNVGLITASQDAHSIATCMNLLINDKEQYEKYKANTLIASKELNWQIEQLTLLNIFSNLG